MEISLVQLNDKCTVVFTDNGEVAYVASYDSVILKANKSGILKIGEDWKYSSSTTRHFNQGLRYLGEVWKCNHLTDISELSMYYKDKLFKEKNLIS